jgi:hypothetical protein
MMLRRANRQIEVFDISLMAVVTKAMGAFLVLMLLLLPYYKGAPPSITSPEEAQRAVAEARREIAQAVQASGEDAAALKQKLEAAEAALQKAEMAIRLLKTELDQVWSQFSRTQGELAEAKEQLARAQTELPRDRQEIAELKAQLRKQQPQSSQTPELMATLELIDSPACRGSLLDPRLELKPEAIFVASGASQPSAQTTIANVDMPWMVRDVLTTSDWATDIQQRLLHLAALRGTNYIAVASDRKPSLGCKIVGQISVIDINPKNADGKGQIFTQSLPLLGSMPSNGPILIAAIGFDGETIALRRPSNADISAWSAAMGGHVPTQPEPEEATMGKGPAGPGTPAFRPSVPGQANAPPFPAHNRTFGPGTPALPSTSKPPVPPDRSTAPKSQ